MTQTADISSNTTTNSDDSLAAASTPILVSAVIPIYNEEQILESAVRALHSWLTTSGHSFEIILCENGSTDKTIPIATMLQTELNEVSFLSVGQPNYGKALREGILKAKGEYIVCDEIDLCDVTFYENALRIATSDTSVAMVVGSKAMKGASDSRPFVRRFATRVINTMLRVSVGFRGTDTHGLKLLRREAILPIVAQCVVDKDLFASELVIRTGRLGLSVVEIPVTVSEKRQTPITLFRRVPGVLSGMWRLTTAIRGSDSGNDNDVDSDERQEV